MKLLAVTHAAVTDKRENIKKKNKKKNL